MKNSAGASANVVSPSVPACSVFGSGKSDNDGRSRFLELQLQRMRSTRTWRWTQWVRNLEQWLRGVVPAERRSKRWPAKGGAHAAVVIPIYNAFEHLGPCIESVLLHTPVDAPIFLIDDASSDPRVAPLLASVSAQHPARVIHLRNNQNLGFVGTVNRGMQEAGKRDVVLLNSDTIVGPDWPRSLEEVSAERRNCASVTAVSNEVSMYSVLQHCLKERPDPRQFDLLAAMLRLTPAAIKPEVPTGVGFCMLLTRRVLDSIGSFDMAFSPGYGE